MNWKPLKLTLAGAVALALPALAGGLLEIQLPPETASFKPAAGVEIANARCLVCHSEEYVSTQPALPKTFWAATIKKMREKYGADVPDQQVEPLIDYLVATYGVKTEATTAGPAVAATSPGGGVSSDAKTPEALGFKYGCTLCHGTDKKIVGPALKDIAAKYRDDPAARAKFAEQIHHGGSGKWGPAIMPPFPMVSDEEIKVLSDWILSLK